MVTNLTMPCIGLQAIYPDKWTWYHSNDAKTTSLPTTLLQFVQCSTSKVALWWNQKLTNLFLAFNVTSIVLIYTQTKVRPPPPPPNPHSSQKWWDQKTSLHFLSRILCCQCLCDRCIVVWLHSIAFQLLFKREAWQSKFCCCCSVFVRQSCLMMYPGQDKLVINWILTPCQHHSIISGWGHKNNNWHAHTKGADTLWHAPTRRIEKNLVLQQHTHEDAEHVVHTQQTKQLPQRKVKQWRLPQICHKHCHWL